MSCRTKRENFVMWKYATLTTVAILSGLLVLRGQANDAAVRQQVIATDERRADALRRNDSAPLRQIYADDYTLVTPAGIVRSKDDQINELVSGRVRYEKLEVIDRTVRVYGDTAILLSRENDSILQAGRQVGGDIRFTRVYKKFGTDWRVIATHGSIIGP
jgi:ketosteroid isomerase-like protein